MADDTRKPCSKCDQVKSLDAFSPSSRGKFGRQASCKECVRAYREANREKVRESQRKYYLANKERIAARVAANKDQNIERSRAYYAENRDAVRAKQAEWRRLNADKKKALDAAYRAANREKIRLYLQWYTEANREESRRRSAEWQKANHDRVIETQRRRRARKRGATIGPVDLEALWTGTCGICGEAMDRSLRRPDPLSKSIDHILPLSKGGAHAQSNLQWAHLVCNFRKGDRFPAVA